MNRKKPGWFPKPRVACSNQAWGISFMRLIRPFSATVRWRTRRSLVAGTRPWGIILLLIGMALPMMSEAFSNRIEKDGVSVAVDVLKPEDTEDVFGADLVRQGTQPLMLMIQNGSAETYRFRKADVDARYIPAAEAARHAYGNPIVTGGRMIGWAVWHVP